MEKITLAARVRENFGKQGAKQVRREGAVPAIVYGHGIKPLAISVGAKAVTLALHTKAGENVLIDLAVEGAALKESTCLIKDIQTNPITDLISHIDFTLISLTEKITVHIPLVARNAEECTGVKAGGVLDIIHHELEVECLPTSIPEKIEVDIKDMNIGDLIHVKDLSFPEGVSCVLDDDDAVLAVHAPREEEAPAESEEVATQPEVIEKGKKPEEGEETEPKKQEKKPEAKKES